MSIGDDGSLDVNGVDRPSVQPDAARRRQDRLAAALRENLRKRKVQLRGGPAVEDAEEGAGLAADAAAPLPPQRDG